MWHGEGHGLLNVGMFKQRLVDLPWRNLLAATIDQLLDAARQEEVSVFVDVALISGTKPTVVRKRGRVGLGV